MQQEAEATSRRAALIVGGVVLLARVASLPRTPWDAEELRFPFAVMLWLTAGASAIAAVALSRAFGARAALLFSFAGAVLLHAPSGRPDALSWMFFALVFVNLRAWKESPLRGSLHGFLCAAAIACQPQFVLSGVALFFAGLMLIVFGQRLRIAACIAFAVTLLPFAFVYGAPENFPSPLTPLNVVRFTLHPWGSKFVALPLLVCVAAGLRRLLREWDARLEGLLWLAFVQTAVGVAIVDPADGARWAIPALMFVAVCASRAGWTGTLLIVAASVWYTAPVLRDRVTRVSPPVAATEAIPPGAVVLFERDAWPGVRGRSLEGGLQQYLDHPEVPLLVYAAGSSNAAGARVFGREDHDAYGKLTRNAWRRVSLIPLMERYVPLRGVHGVERNEAGRSWRWLAQEAEIRLPRGSRFARVELHLPSAAPLGRMNVRINDVLATVDRGSSATIEVPLHRPHLMFHASAAFELRAPDSRRVAVQLMKVDVR